MRTLSPEQLAEAKEYLVVAKKLRELIDERIAVTEGFEDASVNKVAYMAATSGLLETANTWVDDLKHKLGIAKDGSLAEVIELIGQSDSGQHRRIR